MNQTSIVIPFFKAEFNSLELRYALRSIEKNLIADNKVIYLIGDKPDWVKNVIHIACDDISGMDYMKYMDQANKVKIACEQENIGENFIYTYDDIFFINNTTVEELKEIRAIENAEDIDNYLSKSTGSKNYCDNSKKTIELLKTLNLPQYDCETHCPRYFNVNIMLKLFEKYKMHKDPYQFSTLYYNIYFQHIKPRLLKKHGDGFKLGVYSSFSFEELLSMIGDNKIMNINSSGINDVNIRRLFDYLFVDKSKYEKSLFD